MVEPIRKLVVVPCDPETAFKIFAEQTTNWWPREHHSLSAGKFGKPAEAVTIEPKVGGRVYETTPDGEELQWGSVLSYDPGKSICLSWHIAEPEENATEVEVTFTKTEDNKTEVVLIHRNWEVLGDRGQESRDHYNNGWVRVFEERYLKAAEGTLTSAS